MSFNLYYKNYEPTTRKGLKIHKENLREFLFDFRINKKRYRKKFKINATNHSKSENLLNAEIQLARYKKLLKNGHSLNINSTLDECFYEFMKDKNETEWNKKIVRNYNCYIGSCKLFVSDINKLRQTKKNDYKAVKVGNKKVLNLKVWHFENIQRQMKRYELADRTQNAIYEVLNPLYKWMISHDIVDVDEEYINPLKVTIDMQKQKRIVTNAEEKFKASYKAINTVFSDNSFYRAMFLLFYQGRRKTEVLKLKWKYIDFANNTYVLHDTKAKEHQTFTLPKDVKEALLEIPGFHKGYIFKSPILKGKHIKNISHQVEKLNRYLGFDHFSVHYQRHILVTTLANKGVSKIILSALLGHTDLQSINRYITVDYEEAGKSTKHIIENILEVA